MGYDSAHVVRVQRRKKIFAVNYFGGKCQICGYDKCMNALSFHHINPDEKEYSPSYVVGRWKWERAKKELDKCILLCLNCHAETHYVEIDIDLRSIILPTLIKVCLMCEGEYDTKDETRKYCSPECYSFNSRKVDRPTKEDLEKLIYSTTFVHIGRMFGVHDNSVRKWCKKYNLPYRKKDILGLKH